MSRGIRPRDCRFDPGVYLDVSGELVVDTLGEAPTPPRAPARDYFSRWPHRYLRWEQKRGMWEVRQVNPETGEDERYELVFMLEADGVAEHLDEAERQKRLMRMLKSGDPRVYKSYRPFDYRFVGKRIEESREFRKKGAEEMTRDRARANKKQRQKNRDQAAYEVAAGIGELRRYLPVIEELQKTGEYHPGERIPLVSGTDFEED